MAAPRPAVDRPPRPAPEQPQPAEERLPRPWEKRVGTLTAYAPHGTQTMAGFAALLLAPNKIVGAGLFAASQLASVAKTFWERHEKRKKEARNED